MTGQPSKRIIAGLRQNCSQIIPNVGIAFAVEDVYADNSGQAQTAAN
jgi:hypothetical protein